MRVFVCACCVTLALCVLTALAGVFISNTLAQLETSLDALPQTLASMQPSGEVSLEDAATLTARWLSDIDGAREALARRSGMLSAFIGQGELDETDALLATLREALACGDETYYRTTLAALRERLRRLSASERLTLAGIF